MAAYHWVYDCYLHGDCQETGINSESIRPTLMNTFIRLFAKSRQKN